MIRKKNNSIAQILTICVLGFIFGCGGKETKHKDTLPREQTAVGAVAQSLDRAELERRFTPDIVTAVEHSDPEIRARAGTVLGKISSPRVEPLLITLLDDTNKKVRQNAAFSAGRLGVLATPTFVNGVLKRLDSESDPETKRRLIEATGRIGDVNAAVLLPYINSDAPAIAAAAMLALARLKDRFGAIPEEAYGRARRLFASPHLPVRFAAVHMSGPHLSGPRETVLETTLFEELEHLLVTDPSPEIRLQVIDTLKAFGAINTIEDAVWLEQNDVRVTLSGISAVSEQKTEGSCRSIDNLLSLLVRRVEKHGSISLSHLRPTQVALAYGHACPFTDTRRDAVSTLLDLLDKTELDSTIIRRTRCLALAASGRDDLEVMSCNPNDSAMGKQIYIERLAGHSPIDRQNYETLTELIKDGDIRVASTALAVLPKTRHPSWPDRVLDSLSDTRTPLMCEGLSIIARSPAAFQTPETVAALKTIIERGETFDQLVLPMMLTTEALAALDSKENLPLVQRLAQSAIEPVRASAVKLLYRMGDLETGKTAASLGATVPEATVRRVNKQRRKKAELIVETDAGTMVVALLTDAAPAAVDTLISLVKKDYFDNQQVLTDVPGHSLYIGMPHGMGHAVRDTILPEASPHPVELGTVGVRHTDASKTKGYLFISRRRLPQLDGNITVVGRLISGEDVLEQLTKGSAIKHIALSGIK